MVWMWDAVYGGLEPLDHHITTSLGLSPTPMFQKSILNLHRHNSVRVGTYAHSQHIKVLKTLCIQIVWMWDASVGVGSFNHHIITLQYHLG